MQKSVFKVCEKKLKNSVNRFSTIIANVRFLKTMNQEKYFGELLKQSVTVVEHGKYSNR